MDAVRISQSEVVFAYCLISIPPKESLGHIGRSLTRKGIRDGAGPKDSFGVRVSSTLNQNVINAFGVLKKMENYA